MSTFHDNFSRFVIGSGPLRHLINHSNIVSHFLWRRANARNVSFKALYSSQFTLSTQLIIPNYLFFNSPTDAAEIYPLCLNISQLLTSAVALIHQSAPCKRGLGAKFRCKHAYDQLVYYTKGLSCDWPMLQRWFEFNQTISSTAIFTLNCTTVPAFLNSGKVSW